MSDVSYAYVGSTEDAKDVLDRSRIDPDLIISFSDDKEEEISGFARYEGFGDDWLQVNSINGKKAKGRLSQENPDIVFVMSWQELINPDMLEIANRGFVGRHLSMLPKRRGRAPVAWSLIHGLDSTGTTLFWLDDGVDSGPILAQNKVDIERTDEASDLFDKHADSTVELLNKVSRQFESGEFPRTPQNHSEATYTHPRRPDMGLVDWTQSSSRIYDFVRGQTHPYPGAFTYHNMDKIKIWHSSIINRTSISGQPGEILRHIGQEEFHIQCGEGVLQIETENLHREHPIKKGSLLGGHHSSHPS
jgi:methionyl-tRNA formyltransferase